MSAPAFTRATPVWRIAQTLFVTTKTVETHLGAAFRKLGVARRTELAATLP